MALGIQLTVYAALIMVASLAGGLAPAMMRFTHRQLHLLMSFVAGLMLGVGLLHLLPHATSELKSIDNAVLWLMAGLLTMFFLIRAFHFHQHASLEPDEADAPGSNAEGAHSGCLVHDHDHGQPHDPLPVELPIAEHSHSRSDTRNGARSHSHGHSHGHDHDHGHDHAPAHKLSWAGIGLGLTLHTLIDGMALAADVQRGVAYDGGQTWFVGVGTFLAIALHKPLDAMSITTLMASGGWPRGWRFAVNCTFAAMCPAGVMLFFLAGRSLPSHSPLLGAALAFAAGVFICISLGDLLPEIQFHHHDRLQLSLALLLGIALAYGIRFLEPAHVHMAETPEVLSWTAGRF